MAGRDGVHKNRMISVYPDPSAVQMIGGYSSPALNKAVECWAHQIALAKIANHLRFLPVEWEALASVIRGVLPDPMDGRPGQRMADALQAAAMFGQIDKRVRVPKLAAKVADLDYTRTWAVLLVCADHWTRKTKGEWWR